MPFGVAALAVGAYGAYQQADAAKDAARASQRGTDAAIAEQQAARDANQRNIQPYLDFGSGALGQLQRLQSGDTSAFTADPGYQFSLDQALEAVRNRGAAAGNYGGGGTTSDLLRTATGLAQQGYGDFYSRLFNSATIGQNAAAGAGTAGMSTASNIGNLLTANAGAQGDAAINRANAYSNFGGQLGSLLGTYSGGGFGGSGYGGVNPGSAGQISTVATPLVNPGVSVPNIPVSGKIYG